VGHDSLFIKYSKAPVTTLITKDRVLGHNPAAALYTSGFYYKRLFDETIFKKLRILRRDENEKGLRMKKGFSRELYHYSLQVYC